MLVVNKLVVSVSDAACLLSVSDQKIYKLIFSEQLVAYKDGKAWKIQMSSIENYINSRVAK